MWCYMGAQTELLEKKAIREITTEVARMRGELESYLEDLRLYSKPGFWQALNEEKSGNVTRYESVADFASKRAKK